MLTGTTVKLAPLGADDLPTLFRWINERDDVLLNAAYRPVHDEDHRAWFERIRGRPDIVVFGIRLADGDRLIGSCQLHSIDARSGSAELQIRIGEPDARDRGHGREAVELLLRHAFDDLNLRRVFLHVFATNERARRVYERAGFVEEGRLREAAYVDGAFVDVVVMGLLRADRS
ncbi:MAG: GNAT family N-acetyltransferase [Gaiellaceae bacterium]